MSSKPSREVGLKAFVCGVSILVVSGCSLLTSAQENESPTDSLPVETDEYVSDSGSAGDGEHAAEQEPAVGDGSSDPAFSSDSGAVSARGTVPFQNGAGYVYELAYDYEMAPFEADIANAPPGESHVSSTVITNQVQVTNMNPGRNAPAATISLAAIYATDSLACDRQLFPAIAFLNFGSVELSDGQTVCLRGRARDLRTEELAEGETAEGRPHPAAIFDRYDPVVSARFYSDSDAAAFISDLNSPLGYALVGGHSGFSSDASVPPGWCLIPTLRERTGGVYKHSAIYTLEGDFC